MRVVRIYHSGRDSAHRARDRALVAAGVELRLVLPTTWPGPDHDAHGEGFDVVELPVDRPDDVNRHRYTSQSALDDAVRSWEPDLVDLHEEPVALVTKQGLLAAGDLPVVCYTAQNLDKRWPPPFRGHERAALARVQGIYPCSRQAASVLAGKGYRGLLQPLPLGLDPAVHRPVSPVAGMLTLGIVGRIVPGKGVLDAVTVAAATGARLLVVGKGPQEQEARASAEAQDVDVEWHPWVDAPELAALYRQMHVVLVPSSATTTWVEQFGRVITEGWAGGAVPVGYASGSIPEVIGDAGVVVPEGDVTALTEAVRHLDADRTELLRLRALGLARAAKLSWDRVARDQLAFYEQAATLPPPGLGPADRAAARALWGPPARTPVSERPFALPVLRSSRQLSRVVDALART